MPIAAGTRRPRLRPDEPVPTLDAWSGVLFVVLALLSSTAVSLPLSSDPPGRIAALYDEHRTAYVLAQVVGVAGVAAFLLFLNVLRRRRETASPAVVATGALLAVAAIGTNVAVLGLCFGVASGPRDVHRWAVATDVTDDVLFGTYAVFLGALALTRLPTPLRAAAAVAALVCAVRAVRAWDEVPATEVVAPLLAMVVLLALAIRVLRGPRSG